MFLQICCQFFIDLFARFSQNLFARFSHLMFLPGFHTWCFCQVCCWYKAAWVQLCDGGRGEAVHCEEIQQGEFFYQQLFKNVIVIWMNKIQSSSCKVNSQCWYCQTNSSVYAVKKCNNINLQGIHICQINTYVWHTFKQPKHTSTG